MERLYSKLLIKKFLYVNQRGCRIIQKNITLRKKLDKTKFGGRIGVNWKILIVMLKILYFEVCHKWNRPVLVQDQ
jgi:hypothetical protein